MLDQSSRLPLYLQVKDFLLSRMETGEYPVDTKLPTEKELMDLLGVGRVTVRAALQELEYEGRIRKRHGVGTFVAPPPRSFALEPLISLSYSLRRSGFSVTNEVLQNEIVRAGGDLLEQWPAGNRLGHIKRLRKAGNTAMAIEESYFTEETYAILQKLNTQDSFAHALLSAPHVDIGRIDMQVILRQPDEQERTLLGIDGTGRVAAMRRLTYNAGEGQPISRVDFIVNEKLLLLPFHFNGVS